MRQLFLDAARLFAGSLFLVRLIGQVKVAPHPPRTPGPSSPLDTVVLLLLALGIAAGRSGWGAALAAAELLLIAALWLDALLFRVYSIELGLEGVRAVV